MMIHSQRLPLVIPSSMISKLWSLNTCIRIIWGGACEKAKYRHDVSDSLGVGENTVIFLKFKNQCPRILSLGLVTPDLSIHIQQWTSNSFLENSRTLIKEKKKKVKSLHKLLFWTQIITPKGLVTYIYSLLSVTVLCHRTQESVGRPYLKHNDEGQASG